MAVSLIGINSNNLRTQEWQCNVAAELSEIDNSKVPVGSTCLVLTPFTIYIMNSSLQWVSI